MSLFSTFHSFTLLGRKEHLMVLALQNLTKFNFLFVWFKFRKVVRGYRKDNFVKCTVSWGFFKFSRLISLSKSVFKVLVNFFTKSFIIRLIIYDVTIIQVRPDKRFLNCHLWLSWKDSKKFFEQICGPIDLWKFFFHVV